MTPAPIALFAYNRLTHLHQTVEALSRNRLAAETHVWVFSDAAKSEADVDRVREVRDYLPTISGFRSLTIVERDENLGLAESIIAGVTEVVHAHGRVIVVEDDIVTSPSFLEYMNAALERYADEERVISISGYFYPVDGPVAETLFLRGADCWGWATWRRGWDLFEPDGSKLLAELRRRRLERAFDYNGAYPYTQMLVDQIAGKNDSWAIRWHASAFLRDKLTLYPGTSLVENVGNDGTGTHGVNAPGLVRTQATVTPVHVRAIPCAENQDAARKVEAYFRRQKPFSRLIRKWFVPLLVAVAMTAFVIAFEHWRLGSKVYGASGAWFSDLIEEKGWSGLGMRVAALLAVTAAQVAFFWASFVSAAPFRVLYASIFAIITFIEYGYVRATGTLPSAIDLDVIHSSRQYWASAVAAHVDWFAAIPVAVYGAALIATQGVRRGRDLRRLVAVLLGTVALHSAYAAVTYLRTDRTGLMISSPMSTGTMQAFVRTVTLFGWAEVGALWSPAGDPRQMLSYQATINPTMHIVLVIDETVEAGRLSVNGYHRPTTPWLESLQAQGRLANWGVAASVSALSNPSIASILSGLSTLPDRDGLVFSQPTMFQFAKAMNYGTHLLDGQWDSPRFGLSPADHRYIDEFKGVRFFGNDAETDFRMARWVREILQEPLGQFVVVLKRGNHMPYRRNFPSGAGAWSSVIPRGADPAGGDERGESDSYDDALRYNVDAFFRGMLRDDGTLPGAVMIYTSDHGRTYEGFEQAHGVPLMMFGDARPPVDTGFRASHLNIFATILDLFGFPEAHRPVSYGRSLLKARASDADSRLTMIGDLFGRETFEVRDFDARGQ